MRVFHFHSHLDWWGLTGVLLGCIGGILILFGLAFRLGLLFVFLVALVHALNVSRHDHGIDPALVPIEAVIILFCLAFIGPGQYSVDKS